MATSRGWASKNVPLGGSAGGETPVASQAGSFNARAASGIALALAGLMAATSLSAGVSAFDLILAAIALVIAFAAVASFIGNPVGAATTLLAFMFFGLVGFGFFEVSYCDGHRSSSWSPDGWELVELGVFTASVVGLGLLVSRSSRRFLVSGQGRLGSRAERTRKRAVTREGQSGSRLPVMCIVVTAAAAAILAVPAFQKGMRTSIALLAVAFAVITSLAIVSRLSWANARKVALAFVGLTICAAYLHMILRHLPPGGNCRFEPVTWAWIYPGPALMVWSVIAGVVFPEQRRGMAIANGRMG